MRDSELAIYRVSHSFHYYRQTHDLLNDTLTVWAFINDSDYQQRIRSIWPMFAIGFYADRVVFRYIG